MIPSSLIYTFQKWALFKTHLPLKENKLFSSAFEFEMVILFNIFLVLGLNDIWRHNYSLYVAKNAENLRNHQWAIWTSSWKSEYISLSNRNLLLRPSSCENVSSISKETRKTNFFFYLLRADWPTNLGFIVLFFEKLLLAKIWPPLPTSQTHTLGRKGLKQNFLILI